MIDEKLLHVACIVRQTGLYDLLRALEANKVGNVEVRPVGPTPLLPPPEKGERKKRRAHVRPKVLAAMPLREKRTTKQITDETRCNPKSVSTALYFFVKNGLVKRTGFGEFMRIKDEQQ